MPCRYPGCVANTAGADVCAAHAGGDGAPCPRCHGSGMVSRVNERTRRDVQDPCERCSGVGLIDKKKGRPRSPKPVPVDDRDLMQRMKG